MFMLSQMKETAIRAIRPGFNMDDARRAEWLNLFPEIFGRICYDIIGGDSRRGPERLETLSACSSGYYPRD
jgi:hypothetical protein